MLRHDSGAQWTRDNAFGPGATHDAAGTAGNDYLELGALPLHSIVHAAGGAGADTLYGSAGSDLLDGGAGADTMDGREGHDWLFGGAGNDTLYGGGGDDLLAGGRGDDMVYSGFGFDTLAGGEGNDTVVVEGGGHKIVYAPTFAQSAQTDFVWIHTHAWNQARFSRSGTDLQILAGQGTQLIATVKDFYLAYNSIDQFKFADNVWKTNIEAWNLGLNGASGVIAGTAALDGGGIRHYWLDGNHSMPWASVVVDSNIHGQTVETTWHNADGTTATSWGDAGFAANCKRRKRNSGPQKRNRREAHLRRTCPPKPEGRRRKPAGRRGIHQSYQCG